VTLVDDKLVFRRCLAANSTATGWTDPDNTTTQPVTTATRFVSEKRGTGIMLWPFGTDAANETFLMRVIGWSMIQSPAVAVEWSATLLQQFLVTLSENVGAAGVLAATDLIADTIVTDLTGLTGAVLSPNYTIFSPANNFGQAGVYVGLEGFQYGEVQFHRNSSAASANASYAWR